MMLKCGELLAEGGLRGMKQVRSARNAAGIHDRDEEAEPSKIQGPSPVVAAPYGVVGRGIEGTSKLSDASR